MKQTGLIWLALATLLSLLFFGTAQARQDIAQFTVTGLPPVLGSATYEELRSNYDAGMYQFMFNYSGNSTRTFRFQVLFLKDGEILWNDTSNPVDFEPGFFMFENFFEEVSFPGSVSDVFENLPASFISQIIQTGVLPEGSYSFRVTPQPVNMTPPVSVIPSVSNFVVRLPQPPALLMPRDEAIVSLAVPVFTWTPVVAIGNLSVEYVFRIVELLDGQNPGDAMVSNPIYHEQILSQTSLPYTPNLPPLEQGRQYAWQVTARDAAGVVPFAGEGNSPVFTFSFGEQAPPPPPPGSGTPLVLIPGFMELLDWEIWLLPQPGNTFVLNGFTQLRVTLPNGSSRNFRVSMNRLMLRDRHNPELLSGSIRFEESTDPLVQMYREAGLLPLWATFELPSWTPQDGLKVSTFIELHDIQRIRAGRLNLTQNGLSGTVNVNRAGFFTYSDGFLDARLNSLQAEFPSNQLTAAGTFSLFGSTTPCQITGLSGTGSELSGSVNCSAGQQFPLVEGSAAGQLAVNRTLGNMSLDLSDNSFGYDLIIRSRVELLTAEGSYCGTAIDMNLNPTGLTRGNTRPFACPDIRPELNLGLMRLSMQQLTVENLTLDSAAGSWDFELGINGSFRIPEMGNWTSAQQSGISLSPEGLDLPGINFATQLIPLPVYNSDPFRVQVQQLDTESLLWPLFAPQLAAPGPWELSFNGMASTLNSQQLPACLRNLSFEFQNGRVHQDRLIADIPAAQLQNCEVTEGPYLSLALDGLSGQFGSRWLVDGSTEPLSVLNLSGSFFPGDAFSCGSDNRVSFELGELFFNSGFSGNIAGILQNCTLGFGVFSAVITSAEAVFSGGGSVPQQAGITGTADLLLPDGIRIPGSFTWDLINGEFSALNFEINRSLNFAYPAEDPLLTFRLNNVILSENGLGVNGRQLILMNGQSRGVTFDNAVFSKISGHMMSGRALFDEPFALLAEVGTENDGFQIAAVPANAEITLDSALLLNTNDSLELTPGGLQVSGESTAKLMLNSKTVFEGMQVQYHPAFMVFPVHGQGFQISAYAEVFHEGGWIGVLDNQGVYLTDFDLDFVLPERLMLPGTDTAWLQLREGENWLVDAVQDANGNFAVSALPGVQPRLVVPFLNPSDPPVFSDITFDGLVISGNQVVPAVLGGRVIAQLSGESWPGTASLPLSLQQISAGMDANGESNEPALHLSGNLNLFDVTFDSALPLTFIVQNDGILRGNFENDPAEALLYFQGEQMRLRTRKISGSFIQGRQGVPALFSFAFDAALDVNTGNSWQETAQAFFTHSSSGTTQLVDFEPVSSAQPPSVLLASGLSLLLQRAEVLTGFGFAAETGFTGELELLARLKLTIGESFAVFPVSGVAWSGNGITVPQQQVSRESFPGLTLPTVQYAGYPLSLLAVRLLQALNFSLPATDETLLPENAFRFDLQAQLPAWLQQTELNPPDGLLFPDVAYQSGLLSGEMEPFEPLDGAEIFASQTIDDIILLAERLEGTLAGEGGQASLTLSVSGETASIGSFVPQQGENCSAGSAFTLTISPDADGLSGVIDDVKPCGRFVLGPLSLSAESVQLGLGEVQERWLAELQGEFSLHLPGADGTERISSGNISFDLTTRRLSSGSVIVTESFEVAMPWNEPEPFFSLQGNEAVLDQNGFVISGTGNMRSGSAVSAVQYNNLNLRLDEPGILSGSAVIAPDFQLMVLLSPTGFLLLSDEEVFEADRMLSIQPQQPVSLNAAGFVFSDNGTGFLRFSEEEYDALQLVFEEDFTLNTEGIAITRGAVDVFTAEQLPEADVPLAVLSANGFFIQDGSVVELPDRLILSDELIAFVNTRNAANQLVVSITDEEGGFRISSVGMQPIGFPALTPQGAPLIELPAQFSLTTDALFNVTGGTITLSEELPLQTTNALLPATLTGLRFSSSEVTRLKAVVQPELPDLFLAGAAEQQLFESEFRLVPSGLATQTVTIGSASAQPGEAEAVLTSVLYEGGEGDAAESGQFRADITGVILRAGTDAEPALEVSGRFSVSRINEGLPSFEFTAARLAGVSQQEWSWDVKPAAESLFVGQTEIIPDGNVPVSLEASAQVFKLQLNGLARFTNLPGETLTLAFGGIQFGVTQLNTSPVYTFQTVTTTGAQDPQQLILFDGAAGLTLSTYTFGIDDEGLNLTTSGNLDFYGELLPFSSLHLNGAGGFEMAEPAVDDDGKWLLSEHLVLHGAGLEIMTDEGAQQGTLALRAQIAYRLPEPFTYTEEPAGFFDYLMYRGDDNEITTRKEIGGLPAGTFPVQASVQMGTFGLLELTRLMPLLNPFNLAETALHVNVAVKTSPEQGNDETQPVIMLGNTEQPGILVSRTNAGGLGSQVSFAVTSNEPFETGSGLFRLSIPAGAVSMESSQGTFLLKMGGTAGFNLTEVSSSFPYTGLTVDLGGNVSGGSLEGALDISIAGIMQLEAGGFYRYNNPDGAELTITDTRSRTPDALQALIGQSETASVQTTTISNVVEVLCFGSCPAELTDVPLSTAGNPGSALNFSISAESNNNRGMSGQVERFFMYRTSDGSSSMYVEQVQLVFDDLFVANLDMKYQLRNGEVSLQAGGVGAFSNGLSDLETLFVGNYSSVVAANFRRRGGENSFGLFFGISLGAGVTIVPNMIAISQVGGGFFYRPEQQEIDLVRTSLAAFGHDLVNPAGFQQAAGSSFSGMLYGNIGIGPSVGANSKVEGQAFVSIASHHFYIDARATLMGQRDGDSRQVAGMRATGEFAASVLRGGLGENAILISIEADFFMPYILTAGGSLEFFYLSRSNQNPLVGFVGAGHISVLGGLQEGEIEILGGNDGFLFSGGLSNTIGIPLFNVTGTVGFSFWAINADFATMPLGGYLSFEAQINLLIATVSANVTAALVQRSSGGFAFTGAVRGCSTVNLIVTTEQICADAWFQLANPGGVSSGVGNNRGNALISMAKEQQDTFRSRLGGLRQQVEWVAQSMKQAEDLARIARDRARLERTTPAGEEVVRAGVNFFRKPFAEREVWVASMKQLALQRGNTGAPAPVLANFLNNYALAENPFEPMATQAAESGFDALTASIEEAETILAMFEDFDQNLLAAITLYEESSALFDQMDEAFASNPVTSVVRPEPTANPLQSVSFSLDTGRAEQQQNLMSTYLEELRLADLQYRESIVAVTANLDAVKSLMYDDAQTSLMSLTEPFRNTIESFERYYSTEAERLWSEALWARELSDSFEASIPYLNTKVANYRTDSQINQPYARQNVDNEATRHAQRIHFIELLASGAAQPSSWQTGAQSDRPQAAFNALRHRSNIQVGLRAESLREVYGQFYFDMYKNSLPVVEALALNDMKEVQDLRDEHRETVFEPVRALTGQIDSFYNIQANLTALLWNLNNSYVDWRLNMTDAEELLGDAPDISLYEQALQQLSQQLQPPQITAVIAEQTVTTNQSMTPAEIFFTATHPVEIIETAIQYRIGLPLQDGEPIEPDNSFMTLGSATGSNIVLTASLVPGAEVINPLSNPHISLGFRVRGAAGIPAVRRGSFRVLNEFNAATIGTPGGSQTESGEVLPISAAPPQAPLIEMGDGFIIHVNEEQTEYWVIDRGQINIRLTSHDAVSGIGRFQYALGTSPGDTTVVGWTDLQGERLSLPDIPAEQIRAPFSFQAMQQGTRYYVSARVINNDNWRSEATASPYPIIYESDPPGEPVLTFIPQPAVPFWNKASSQVQISQLRSVDSIPESFFMPYVPNDALWAQMSIPTEPAKLAFQNVQVSPPSSGVRHFEYVLSRNEEVPFEQFQNGAARIHEADQPLTITSNLEDPVFRNHKYPMYVHIRAISNFGYPGPINTSGPYAVEDPTVPWFGHLFVAHRVNRPRDIDIYIWVPPSDPESDVLGYEYSIIQRPHGSNFHDISVPTIVTRDFPAGDAVDIPWDHQMSVDRFFNPDSPPPPLTPAFHINTGSIDRLPGHDVYLILRAINTQGYTSMRDVYGPLP
ncbi:MAG: hypothetical protein LAT75_07875 [Candidatus Cyclonatronum sp.]|uniref:hypothetical protein n=1 Tax=Cyclonatronum sp. TaxID=3024185 RepID=UPI0025BAC29F|nr:hypothetical protein [Cyclonatronum sp.]MCH8486768.1 hypothetical protein [Cyclonatronum sp.]